MCADAAALQSIEADLMSAAVDLLDPELEADPRLLSHVRAAIDDIRAGKMVILVDDEDRENEGDLVFAAEKVTPEHINFMAKYGRGLICLTLTPEQVQRLDLPMMERSRHGGPPLGTAFTLSIEARHGVTTGISAADRAHTIRVAASPLANPDDVVTPGHIFPLRAREGGVLVRTGQTEGSVDLSRLAGLSPAGVICEIMNDDGTMARMPDLELFAEQHGLRVLTIADLIQYRLQTERFVKRIGEIDLTLDQTGTPWRLVTFSVLLDGREFAALVKGDPQKDNALCRVHRGNLLEDLFSSRTDSGGRLLRAAIERIEREGAGVIIYISPDKTLSAEASARGAETSESAPVDGSTSNERTLRELGLGAQVLQALGIARIRLLTNSPRKLPGLRGYGLEVVECLPFGE
jgi:3,4-dihydroxy 2-butanone 4-phosphate synthase/GTP cyclohydrolase II